MNNCEDFSKQLSDFLDGETSSMNIKLLNAHLASCPSCKSLFESYRLVLRSLKSLPKVNASKTFEKRLRMQIQKEIEDTRRIDVNRMKQTLGSIPIKPVFVTVTAAAAILAISIVIQDRFFTEEQGNQHVITPKLTPPPRPGARQSPAPMQNPYMQQQNFVQIGSSQDSSTQYKSNIGIPGSSAEEILKNLKAQSQVVKARKQKDQ